MGGLAERLAGRLEPSEAVRFADIPGVGAPTVEGHAGEIRIGRWIGAGGDPTKATDLGPTVALVMGRRHAYEGEALGMAPLMRWLADHGIDHVVAVSAAGSLRGTLKAGELIVIRDIIDLQNRERLQPGLRRTTGQAHGHDAAVARGALAVRPRLSGKLTLALEAAAARAGIALHRGALACGAGPAYETPAEVRALQEAGVDVATMSAAPETQFVGELGMDIAIVAAVTNPGTGIGPSAPDHTRVLEVAQAMCGALGDVFVNWLDNK